MQSPDLIELPFTGAFSLDDSVDLAAKAAFLTGRRRKGCDKPAALTMALLLEGYWSPIGVRVEQHDDRVCATVLANSDGVPADDICDRLRQLLSLDGDGAAFAGLAARDPVIGALYRRCPGIRPVLFSSPYEAAARAIIGQRLPVRQAEAIHARLAAEHGAALTLDGAVLHSFPAPAQMVELSPIQGVADRKVEQLRALAHAAAQGWLDRARLRSMAFDDALSHLQHLPGIGPFSAELILLRGSGDPDAFPRQEKRLHHAMAAAYGMGDDPPLDLLDRIAEGWRPCRSWAGLLLRNAKWIAAR